MPSSECFGPYISQTLTYDTTLTSDCWQAYAPWDKRSKVEQDLRLTRGIASILADEILSKRYLQSGWFSASNSNVSRCMGESRCQKILRRATDSSQV